jgi:hypothetical protein
MATRSDEEAEGVRAELARLRARFGVDPALPSRSLSDPWQAPTGSLEEDEAEFADAMADCLSAGLPLDAALAFWISGSLAERAEADAQAQSDDDLSYEPPH